MILEDILDFLEEQNALNNFGFKNFYIGKLNTKEDYSLGVYNLKKNGTIDDMYCVGGLRTFKVLNISLLLHINDSFRETEEISNKFFNYLLELGYKETFKIKDYSVSFVKLLSNNEDVGQDDNGIYERVINVAFYYK